MEKIELSLELPKINGTIVARKKDSLNFLDTLLFEKESSGARARNRIGWYLYLKDPGPNRRYFAACAELEPDEVQYLQNSLKKALNKLIVLEKVKISGLYTLYLDGVKNLKLEVKGDGTNAWLEYTLLSDTYKKFVTRLSRSDVTVILQKLQAAQSLGQTLVRELEIIDDFSENIRLQEKTTGRVPTEPEKITTRMLTGEELAKHFEAMVKKQRK